MGICGSDRSGQSLSRTSYKYPPPSFGSPNQNLWMDMLEEMGGQFWPLEEMEEDMPEVGAKYPMMLYDGERECIVYDDKEYDEAKKNGFREHPSMLSAGQAPPKPEKPLKTEVHPGYVPPKPEAVAPKPSPPHAESAKHVMPPPIPKAPAKVEVKQEVKESDTRTTTVSVQRTVDVKKPVTPPKKGT
jgi:hypothetical protein